MLVAPLAEEDQAAATLLEDRTERALRREVFDDADTDIGGGAARAAANSEFSQNGRERNMLFLRRGAGFLDTGAVSGADAITDGRSFVVFDADDDGDLDLVVKNLQRQVLHYFRNDVVTDAARIALQLRGTTGSRDAIGARVTVTAGGRTRVREVRSAAGFLAQSPTELFFGLGDAECVDAIEIRWPGGVTETFGPLDVDKRYHVIEGEEPVVVHDFPASNDRSLEADPYPPARAMPFGNTRARTAPELPSRTLNEAARTRRPVIDHPTLVSFVTTWCTSCRADLALLDRLAEDAERGFDIVVIQVEAKTFPAGRDLEPERRAYPFYAADLDYDGSWRGSARFAAPTSYWVDGRGEIRHSYIGALDEARIRADLQQLGSRDR